MTVICKLNAGQSQNNIDGYFPATKRPYYNKAWADLSGNNNHGSFYATSTQDSDSGWDGSYDFSDYYHYLAGKGNNYVMVPSLYNTNFPQTGFVAYFEIDRLSWSANTNCPLFGDYRNNAFYCYITSTSQGGGGYALAGYLINNTGTGRGTFGNSTAANVFQLNTPLKVALRVVPGASGSVSVFMNKGDGNGGVKILQNSITDATTALSAQQCLLGKGAGADRMKFHYFELDNDGTLSDATIIAKLNTEWKTHEYTLPDLNYDYSAFGDSITWTQANGLNYPNLLHTYVKNTYGIMPYRNKGIGGITSNGLVTNLNTYNYPDSNLVTIGVGTNDCANQGVSVAQYTANLNATIDYIRSKNADTKIILCTPVGTSDANRTPYIADYRTAMVNVASAKGTYLCRFDLALPDAQMTIGTYTADGIHPNAAGHSILYNDATHGLKLIIDQILTA